MCGKREGIPPDADKKVKLMCSYCKKHNASLFLIHMMVELKVLRRTKVTSKVLDLLEDACESLLDREK
ncbi:Low molecular weight phosphotyrosine protein phosphatase [Arabidopsis thaliana]|uniref:Low molecular weight phosphotyrosine protein phosphatase n=1 Tax=Arabidopsis thaliana TaxID=3702 RepID=A0A1I9LQM1_ARATH|nr:Low molecular weight phosphotyrosine protein phosphatase [Arabidopsis thaliana]ANM64879.1 Low molecular weight phosphotyrosine protein phosphatase [Arabidopsis thaliana]|eukprot:NP_001326882.1 Low molecular weight phosphotyrosine protein phosphatase [Arabidopsis thaliana]